MHLSVQLLASVTAKNEYRKISGRKGDHKNSGVCKFFRVAHHGQPGAVWELWGTECCRIANKKNEGEDGDHIRMSKTSTPPLACFSVSCFLPFVIPMLLHLPDSLP